MITRAGLGTFLPDIMRGRCADGTTYNAGAMYFVDPCTGHGGRAMPPQIPGPAPIVVGPMPIPVRRGLSPLVLLGGAALLLLVLR